MRCEIVSDVPSRVLDKEAVGVETGLLKVEDTLSADSQAIAEAVHVERDDRTVLPAEEDACVVLFRLRRMGGARRRSVLSR